MTKAASRGRLKAFLRAAALAVPKVVLMVATKVAEKVVTRVHC